MSERPPYLRIADEIAGDIRAGRLAPGQAAPSTRRIVRERGVAMATATKVIGALREQGLVETVPGRGTVVRAREETPPAATGRGELSAARIVAAGVRIADAEGLALVTMRRVAGALGVSTMALYRHVASRGELTFRMADAVMAEARLPDPPPAGWRRRLETAAHQFWAVFRRHPWAAELFSLTRPQMFPNALPFAEFSFSTLRAMGFGADDMVCAHVNLFGHVRNMALVRLAETHAEEDTGMSADDWARHTGDDVRRVVSPARHPGIEYVMREGFDYDLDRVFEYGLQRLLDGIDARRRALGLPEPPGRG
ncbi:TetR/AcrR family transcriptional regulator C-terminal domain-containing protein [Nonomuraea pusilla]|uniref:Transcriptional regulator, TetR family n=1 Tax=Nonomuraea pusilla TaxID=46177 RepID=A0A1H7XKM7_9ACTN|nr:TetR/AcrR family transcriptional regulator C-terminal domain-containing protein [Nonomuraea pusilla]SEM34346.1 transcriptional regulator, TetR family [Nonomuraea pusilla]